MNCDLEDRIDDVDVTDLIDDVPPPQPPGYSRGDDRTDDVDADATEEEAGCASAAVGWRE